MQEEHKNATAQQIDNLEKLLAKIEKDSNKILFIIFNMWNIYIKYLGQANKLNKKYNEIHIWTLKLEQKLYISNYEKKQIISLLQQQIIKVKHYKKIIDIL